MSSPRTTDRPARPAGTGRPRRRRRLWVVLAVLAVVLLAVAVLGPRLYARVQEGKAAAPLVTAGSAPTATATAPATDATLDGDWVVTNGGTAGYRVAEVLNGQDVTVTGRTDQVTGSLTVDGGRLTAGTVSVDLASVETDSSARDGQFRGGSIMDVERFPTADFAVTSPVPLGGLDAGATVAVQLTGTLTL